MSRSRKLGAFLVKALAASIAPLWLWFWLMPQLYNEQTRGGTDSCLGKLHSLGIASARYQMKNGSLPASRNTSEKKEPVYSWRVALLPFLGEKELALEAQYNKSEPWNGPSNKKLHSAGIRAFHCSSDNGPRRETSYVAVVGENLLFPTDGHASLMDVPGVTTGPKEFRVTGTQAANTILLVETHHSGIHWMEPRDLSKQDSLKGINKTSPGISSEHLWNRDPKDIGAVVLFADRSARWLSDKTDPKLLQSLLEIKNPEKPHEKVGRDRR